MREMELWRDKVAALFYNLRKTQCWDSDSIANPRSYPNFSEFDYMAV
jgi:hypothetical protein